MKKIIILLLCFIATLSIMTACTTSPNNQSSSSSKTSVSDTTSSNVSSSIDENSSSKEDVISSSSNSDMSSTSNSQTTSSNSSSNSSSEEIQSNAKELISTTVCGVGVVSNLVSLSNVQFEVLQNDISKVICKVSEKATATVSLSEKTLTIIVTAEDSTTATYTITINVLSSEKDLTSVTVCGVVVLDNSVTLTTAQFSELQNNISEVVCVVSEKATSTASLSEKTLTIIVTAEDNTTATYTITIRVLSNLSTIKIDSVKNVYTSSNVVWLTENTFKEFLANQDLTNNVKVTNAPNSTYSLTYDQDTRVVTATCTSEDKSTSSSSSVTISVVNAFGSSLYSGYGASKNATYSYSDGGYKINGTTAVLKDNLTNLTNNYSFSADIILQNLVTNSELVFMSYQETNLLGRFVIRAVSETEILIFTDYKHLTNSFVHYTELKTGIAYNGETLNLKVINKGNSLVMIYGGETLYRLTLDGMTHSDLIIDTVNCNAIIKNRQINDTVSEIATEYENALINYQDTLVSKSLINTSENIAKFVQNEDGSLYVNGASSNSRVMAGLYIEGKAVSGYEWATSGTLSIANTKTSGGSASKIEFQIAQNTSKFVKWHIFRFPSNNTIHRYITDSSKNKNGSDEVLKDSSDTKYLFAGDSNNSWTVDYVFIYNNGIYELWIKDSVNLTTWTMIDTYDSGWGYTMFCLAMRQYADVTFSNLKAYYNEDFDTLYNSLHTTTTNYKLSSNPTSYVENGDVVTNGNFYYVDFASSGRLFIYDDTTVLGGNVAVSGTLSLTNHTDWKQAEITIYQNENYGIRFVLEYVNNGYYQVFTESKQGDTLWQNWKAIRLPNSLCTANLNFTVISYNGSYYLLIDGYKYFTYSGLTLENPLISLTGNSGVKISNLSHEVDETNLQTLVDSQDYVYVSGYSNSINSLATEYKNAETGGILLAGSSSIDYWDTWQEDLGTDVLAYNVGIGGTTTYDWEYAYDKLITPFAPSKLVIFLGGNDITNLGATGTETAQRLMTLLSKVHTDFLSCEVYYVLQNPTPSTYANGEWKNNEFKILRDLMQENATKNSEWLTAIDMQNELLVNGTELVPEYYHSDNVHLSTAGYEVWARVIKEYIFKENA